jgi:hypothetical protein
MNLDIAFSDHRMLVTTLGAFGEVVRAIRRACDDDQLRFWSFIRYVSVNRPEVLGVSQPPEQQAECDAVLARGNPPPVVVEESGLRRLASLPETYGEPGSRPQVRRPWWRFWG